MKNDKLWLIVLFNGNHMPLMIDKNRRQELTLFLKECIKSSKDDPYHYSTWGEFTIISKNIIGWYFKEVEETVQERILKATEKMVGDASSGEDWKSE